LSLKNKTLSKGLSYQDAILQIADKLQGVDQEYKLGSFWEFVRDVWSLSFDRPQLFNAWHVGFLAEDIQDAVEQGLHYCAVLPRAHFKSTILGHAFTMWRMLTQKKDLKVLYLSYSDTMAKYHINELKKEVKRNPILMKMLVDKAPKADYTFRMQYGQYSVEVERGGLFSFKRGMHLDGALIADDILKDPENPLNITQVSKVTDHFMTESMFIPNKGAPIVVVGTPLLPDDILNTLSKDERFRHRKLPVFDPVPGRSVLAPELFSRKELEIHQKAKPKSFASEFLLEPFYSSETYFTREDIDKAVDPKLRNLPALARHKFGVNEEIFGGFDVGKKRHPSHLAIFRRNGSKIYQIHSSYLNGWNYTDQVEYLNEVADNFNLTRGYVDNTRGELEDRGLTNTWVPTSFTQKMKANMAGIMEELILGGRTSLLDDPQQNVQLMQVNNDLKATTTVAGHGDAFFSIGMALQATYETDLYGMQDVGNLQGWVDSIESNKGGKDPVKTWLERLESPKDEEYNNLTEDAQFPLPDAPNPNCTNRACTPKAWIKENNLCLMCLHRGDKPLFL
jgi:hypothetical protein